jgi:hypothetical protein
MISEHYNVTRGQMKVKPRVCLHISRSTARCSRVVSTPASDLRGPGCNASSGGRLSRLRFSSISTRHTAYFYILPNPLPTVIRPFDCT